MISELLNILNRQSVTQVLVKTTVDNNVTQGNPIQREREPRRDSWGKINVQGTRSRVETARLLLPQPHKIQLANKTEKWWLERRGKNHKSNIIQVKEMGQF